ncbi:retinal-specific phospholipid-transporting ATPase ABCA4-like [Schistocerca gregaria]|uniref:retinal-specific phospholipid-transporting ATPase ABCA4-like n=1 Tax=Schistocerca gregaria TaxID=7010 RepID=UPI00211E62CA|nr:retinal-specific phospholipid-transporting ATPase ABCA4-like [Schistocerca gregaria]
MMKELAVESGLDFSTFEGIDVDPGEYATVQNAVKEYLNGTLYSVQGVIIFNITNPFYDPGERSTQNLWDSQSSPSDSGLSPGHGVPEDLPEGWKALSSSEKQNQAGLSNVSKLSKYEYNDIEFFDGKVVPPNPSYYLYYHTDFSNLPLVQALVHFIENYCFYHYFADNGIDTSGIRYNISYMGYPSPPNLFASSHIPAIISAILYNLVSTVVFASVLSDLVQEKSSKLRASLHRVGLNRMPYYLSWITYILAVSALMTLGMCAVGTALPLKIFRNSNFLVMFILYFTLNFSMGCLALFVSTFIHFSDSALTVSYLFITFGSFLQFLLTIGDGFVIEFTQDSYLPVSSFIRVLFKMFPFGISAYIYNFLLFFTSPLPHQGDNLEPIGLSFSSFGYRSRDLPRHLTLLSVYSKLWIISLVSLVLYWYFDNVLFRIGTKKRPVYFFLTPSYWGIRFKRRSGRGEPPVFQPPPDLLFSMDPNVEAEYRRAVEVVRSGAEKEVAINAVNVSKVYKPWYSCGGKSALRAVDSLSISVRKGEFFTILGHNGAGKTTLFSVLSGESSMTAGYVRYFGYDLDRDSGVVRDMLGCCLQHDMFWPELTALEHLDLLHQIHGVKKEELESRGMELLRLVDLEDVAHHRVDSFSGGMKRRLSFAISCTGDPQILFLDEPSSGLDPENYKRLWRVLQSLKGRVTIVLVTHNMLEAELLSDRVGVMVDGQFKAIGTVLDLKSRFGHGYQVVACTGEEIGREVAERYRREYPYLEVRECEGDGTRLEMEVKKSDIERMPELLSALEKDGKIESWNVSQSSLESVFMSIAEKYELKKAYEGGERREDEEGVPDAKKEKGGVQKSSVAGGEEGKVGGGKVEIGKRVKSYPLSALFKVSWKLQLRRNKYSTGCVALLPALVLVMLVLMKMYLMSEYDRMYGDILAVRLPNASFYRLKREWPRGRLGVVCHDCSQSVLYDPGVDPKLLGVAGDASSGSDGYYSSLPRWTSRHPISGALITFCSPPELTKESDQEVLKKVYGILQTRLKVAASRKPGDGLVDLSKIPLHYLYTKFHKFSLDSRDADAPRADMDITLMMNDYYHSSNPGITFQIRDDLDFVLVNGLSNPDGETYKMANVLARLQEFTVHLRLYRVAISASLNPDDALREIDSDVSLQPVQRAGDKSFIDKLIAEIFGVGILPYALSLFIPLALYGIVKEKGSQTKQMMYIHGLSPIYYYLNIFIVWSTLYLTSVLLFLLPGIFLVEYIRYAASALFLFLLGWGLSILSFVFLVSTFVRSTGVATFIGFGIAIFVGTLVKSIVVDLYDPFDAYRLPPPTWLYLWLQTNFLRCLQLISVPQEGGLLVGQLWASSLPPEFVRCLCFLYLCAFIYFVLFLLSIVFLTGDFSHPHYLAVAFWSRVSGSARDALRRLLPSRCAGSAPAPVRADSAPPSVRADPDSPVHEGLRDVEREAALVSRYATDSSLRDCPLVIQGLRKKYPGGKVAVKEFYLHAPLSTCFGLLGENGAGKSTLLSMLTGTIPITSGTAHICGFDISRQLSSALKCIGCCPQRDILWDELTVQEHLEFYARLGGVHPSKSRKYVKKFLCDVGLYHCRHRRSSKLSGGMKRRLSLSIAICANSYVVFLDEPSCGLDVMNKRQIWDVIQHNKRGRVTLITTHSMDEADALCDKIGIMAQGSLWCYGNPQYIKTLYNQGANLRVVFSDETLGPEFIKQRIPSSFSVSKLSNTTEYHIPPSQQPLSLIFQTMLDPSCRASGIEDWGLSQPGLEHAFEQIINHVRSHHDPTDSPFSDV